MPNNRGQKGFKNPPTQRGNWFGNIHVGLGKERSYLVENVSMLVAGGMTVLSAIDAVTSDMRSRSMKKILGTLHDDIEGGSPLWKAFEHSRLFSDHTISLIRLGEETGKLSDNLKLVAAQEEKDRVFRSKIQSAMMYPVFVLSLTAIVGVTIAWFILPRLATVFTQLRIELPLLTQWLIAAGGFLGTYGMIVIPLFFLVLSLVVFFVFYFSKTKFIGQAILFTIPGIKKLLQEVELVRFGYLLGTLLEAGVPITQALDSLYKATVFPRYKKLYAHLRESVQEGNSFQKSFLSYKKTSAFIPTAIQRLIITGEQSGNLSATFFKISTTFEERTENTTKNVTVILEPILLVIVWLGVVAVALAVILPIYNLVGGLNTNPSKQVEQSKPVENTVSITEEFVVEEPVLIESIATSTSEILVDEEIVLTLEILPTSVGYVNVRDTSSLSGGVIGRALPGETYKYLGQDSGWYEIILEDGGTGWIFENYVSISGTQ